MKFILITLLLFTNPTWARDLKIESLDIFKTVVNEMEYPGSSPEIYPISEKYRLDLSLLDLIDQTTNIAHKYDGINEKLALALGSQAGNFNFMAWLRALKQAARENEKFYKEINRKLYLQFYAPSGVALLPDYKYIDFKKIKDNGKISRIRKYNQLAGDPEGRGLLLAFKQINSPFYITSDLTVAKFKRIKSKTLKRIKKSYYQNIALIYNSLDNKRQYHYRGKKLRLNSTEGINRHSLVIFKTIHALPNKHQLFMYLASELEDMPYVNSMYALPYTFINTNLKQIKESLREYTLQQLLRSEDDQYLLQIRKWMKINIDSINSDLEIFNRTNDQRIAVVYTNKKKLPRRVEAIASQKALLTLYPDAPWYKGRTAVLVNRNGKNIYLDKNLITTIGRNLSEISKSVIQTETYLSLLAGTTTLILTNGNIPIAMGTQKLVKKAIKTSRYDREWEKFFQEAPQEVINTILLSSGFAAGRFYNILALGAGQGAIQSYFTGQDIAKGAMVGAGLNLIQYYVLPTHLSRPMSRNLDAKALALNRRLETLEKSIRGIVQGSVVAGLEGDSILKGSFKGLAYGFVSAKVLIWFYGTRYYAFKDFDTNEVDEMIRMENQFQNEVGRGHFDINRQLILDANYRVGGLLPDFISASITLPGNVAMADGGFNRLTTLTHEAHHLMQQQQSGVFGFYLFRYIPTTFVTGYNGHPDENFLKNFIRDYR